MELNKKIIWFHHFMANRWRKSGNSDILLTWAQNHWRQWLQPRNFKKCLLLGRKTMTKLDSVFKKQRCKFSDKGPYSQRYDFSTTHVWMEELDHKEGWVPNNLCFPIVVLEQTLESPLDFREIQPVNPKGSQPCIFIGRTDDETEAPILWPSDVKSWFIGRDPGARKDWRQEEKGMTEDEMVGWHHWCNGHEFDWALGVGDGQGDLMCCSPRGRKESYTTERLNWLN